jgi:hypothetical protein
MTLDTLPKKCMHVESKNCLQMLKIIKNTKLKEESLRVQNTQNIKSKGNWHAHGKRRLDGYFIECFA